MKLNRFLFPAFLFILLVSIQVQGQWDSYRQEGEVGLTGGFTHYYGDLNTKVRINYIQPVSGVFYRRQFGNYIAARVSMNFAQTGYSDQFNTYNSTLVRRNLSFFTNLSEVTLQGDFNFFKYRPGDRNNNFTPYLTFGIGFFSFAPYTKLNIGGKDTMINLLKTRTEPGNPATTKSGQAICFPIGVGIKYALSRKITVGAEVAYRFTTTDYLDDVSKNYLPLSDANNPISDPSLIYDPKTFSTVDPKTGKNYIRFSEATDPITLKPLSRGYNPNINDHYLFAQLFLSFNFITYRCPKAY
jgi:hypothetical protein